MAINLTTPQTVVLQEIVANRFEIPMYRVENRPDGLALIVSLNALHIDGNGDVQNVWNLVDREYAGARLNQVAKVAGINVVLATLASLSGTTTVDEVRALLAGDPAVGDAAGFAYYEGTKSALYGARRDDGDIPPG